MLRTVRRAVGVVLALALAAGAAVMWSRQRPVPAAAATAIASVVAPAPARPRRIVIIGDSVAGEVAAAASAATVGRADVDYVLTIGTANVNDDWWDVWPRVLTRDRPDAIGVLVGPWEINRPDLGTPAWAAWYGARLDRWGDLLTRDGAHLYWITPAPARDPVIDARLRVVTSAFLALAARRPTITIVDAAGALGAPDYLERATTGERLRRIDGLHLCPAGAARVADAVLDAMAIPAAPGRPVDASATTECPP